MVFYFPLGFNRLFGYPALILLAMSVLVEIILFYLLYRFIAGFLVPLYRTTTTMRQQFRDVNSHPPANGPSPNARNSETRSNEPAANPKSGSGKGGEYIDFEEV